VVTFGFSAIAATDVNGVAGHGLGKSKDVLNQPVKAAAEDTRKNQ
jgi:hypothetical protein